MRRCQLFASFFLMKMCFLFGNENLMSDSGHLKPSDIPPYVGDGDVVLLIGASVE